MRIRFSAFDQNNGIDRYKIASLVFSFLCGRRLKAVFICEPPAFIRLERGKLEIPGLIVLDNKIHRGVAKIANPVEENHRAHVKILPHPVSESGAVASRAVVTTRFV